MKNKQDLKVNQGKDRIYIVVKGTSGIQRLYVWMGDRYLPPQGKTFIARRWESGHTGGKKRRTAYFETLPEAREWQRNSAVRSQFEDIKPAILATAGTSGSIDSVLSRNFTMQNVVDRWRKEHLYKLQDSSIETYEKALRLHFSKLLPMQIYAITPDALDVWISDLIENKDHFKKGSRTSFRRELSLLSSLFNFYVNCFRDHTFRSPLLKSHKDRAELNLAVTKTRELEITEPEFYRFHPELLKEPRIGAILAGMALVQFYQVLRIQEVAGLPWKSIILDGGKGGNSRIWVHQSIAYLRSGSKPPYIKRGLKNGPEKILHMLEETVDFFSQLHMRGESGLVFADPETGTFFPYHTIKNAYDRAFVRAGLP